jgi:hypothetical protein
MIQYDEHIDKEVNLPMFDLNGEDIDSSNKNGEKASSIGSFSVDTVRTVYVFSIVK